MDEKRNVSLARQQAAAGELKSAREEIERLRLLHEEMLEALESCAAFLNAIKPRGIVAEGVQSGTARRKAEAAIRKAKNE